MVSRGGKRSAYVLSDSENYSSEDSENSFNSENNNTSSSIASQNATRSTRKPKCYSKNALMARENRLKKKMYVSNLENSVTSLKKENKKLSTVIDNQSFLIATLKTEIKYLKSVLANSSDISNLVRNIHQSTGMSVSSSLGKNLTLNNDYVSKQSQNILSNRSESHPWSEKDKNHTFQALSSFSVNSNNNYSELIIEDNINLDVEMDLGLPNFPCEFSENDLELYSLKRDNNERMNQISLNEHNYTSKSEEDIGVCLHISKSKVSIECCSSCNENAKDAWRE